MSDDNDDDEDGVSVISGFIMGCLRPLTRDEITSGAEVHPTVPVSCPEDLPEPMRTQEDLQRSPIAAGTLFSIFVAAADGAVPGWRAFLQGSAGMSNGEWREAMVPLRFVPLTSHRLRSTILGIIIVIECRWCRFLQRECRVGVRGRTGVAGPAGGSSQDKTHQLQVVDSHCRQENPLLLQP